MMPLLPIVAPVAIAAAARAAPAEELRGDTRGRPVVGVQIDGRGPFDMVVDTAAQASLLTDALARELALPVSDRTLDVVGATGVAEARLYRVRRFATALFDRRDGEMVTLPNAGSTDARGIVGIDMFADRKLVFDHKRRSLSAGPSAPAAPGFVAVKGRTTAGKLLIVPVTLDGTAMQAIVDTGAAVTMANPAALRAMGWADDDPRLKEGGTISGATAAARRVRLATIDRLAIGPVTLRNVRMIFPGDEAFSGAASPDVPMLILGSDLLNLLEAFAVDTPRAELQIRVPGAIAARPG